MDNRSLLDLTDAHIAECARLEAALSGSAEDKAAALQDLIQESAYNLYIYVHKIDPSQNAKIRECCESKEFNAQLVNSEYYLKCLPNQTMIAIDRTVTVTPFQQLMGYVLFVESNEVAKNNLDASTQLLKQACDKKSYHALNERIQRNVKQLGEMKEFEFKSFSKIVNDICEDAKLMGNIYRALGYYNSAFALLAVVNIYKEIPGVKQAMQLHYAAVIKERRAEKSNVVVPTNEIAHLMEALLVAAMQYFYLAYFSYSSTISVMLKDTINQKNELLEEMKEYFAAMLEDNNINKENELLTETEVEETWKDGQRYLAKILPLVFDVRSPSLFSRSEEAAQKIASEFPLEYPNLKIHKKG